MKLCSNADWAFEKGKQKQKNSYLQRKWKILASELLNSTECWSKCRNFSTLFQMWASLLSSLSKTSFVFAWEDAIKTVLTENLQTQCVRSGRTIAQFSADRAKIGLANHSTHRHIHYSLIDVLLYGNLGEWKYGFLHMLFVSAVLTSLYTAVNKRNGSVYYFILSIICPTKSTNWNVENVQSQ